MRTYISRKWISRSNLQNCHLTAANVKYLSWKMFKPCYTAQHDYKYYPTPSDIPLLITHSTVMQRAIQRRIWHAPSLYKFASLVSADVPVVMKYSLFSWVLLFNMQGTPCVDGSDGTRCVYVSVTMREREFHLNRLCIWTENINHWGTFFVCLHQWIHLLPLKCLFNTIGPVYFLFLKVTPINYS